MNSDGNACLILRKSGTRMLLSKTLLTSWVALNAAVIFFCGLAHGEYDIDTVLGKMETAYDEVKDYQAEVELKIYDRAGSVKIERFIYTFKKPKWIRLDFLSPHPGMILVYPDKNGKVLVIPSGLLRMVRFHLALDNSLLREPSGQRIDQTDMGLLIKNMRHSLTDRCRGAPSISEDEDAVQIEVLAEDHFREGVETRYRFLISKKLWLPMEVDESTLVGVLERKISFRNLRVNIGVSDSLFQ